MTATRSTVELWQDMDWLQGAAADGNFVHSETVARHDIEPGNLVRHSYRFHNWSTRQDETIAGWWVVFGVRQSDTNTWLELNWIADGTGHQRTLFADERAEVRTDTRVNL